MYSEIIYHRNTVKFEKQSAEITAYVQNNVLDDYLKKINISQFELGAVNSVINCTYPFTESFKYRSQSYEDILVKIGDKNKALRCKEN